MPPLVTVCFGVTNVSERSNLSITANRKYGRPLVRWVALERGQLVHTGHPANTFSNLDVRARRYQVRIIISSTLDIDDARQYFGIGIKRFCRVSH